MKRLILEPNGWPTTLKDCSPGHFVYEDNLCFKTEYRAGLTPDNPVGTIEAYCETGEFFVGATETEADRERLIVQSVTARWVDDDE